MKHLLFIAVTITAISFLGSCKSKPKEPKDYVDVSSYLKGQLKYIDTVPFAFLKVLQQDSVYTDSQFISKEQVKAIVQPFLVKEIEKKNFEENFKEVTFADETIESLTLNYESIDEDIPVTRVDIYVNPEKETITQLYLVRHEEKGDSSIVQQLLWKHNKSLVLITSKAKKDQPEKTITEKVIWDEREEN